MQVDSLLRYVLRQKSHIVRAYCATIPARPLRTAYRFNARTLSLDVRYRSLPLLTEMADGLPFAPLIDETSSSYRLTTLATDLSPTASVRYSPLLATDCVLLRALTVFPVAQLGR